MEVKQTSKKDNHCPLYEDNSIHIYTYKRSDFTLKPQETRQEFIRMRAEGKSYSRISAALHISKSTCTEWERELKSSILALKQDQLEELYDSYFMTKEARIKRLGDTLGKIDEALNDIDFRTIPPEKLLDYKLKYAEALKEEYTGSGTPYCFSGKIEPAEIVEALGDLLERIRAGEVTPEQASRESAAITNLLKAYDTVEVKAKIDTLETVIGGRG